MSTKKPISKAIFYKDLYITIYGMNGTPWYNSEKMNNKKSVTKKYILLSTSFLNRGSFGYWLGSFLNLEVYRIGLVEFPNSRRGRFVELVLFVLDPSTGKSLSEALIFSSDNPQYDDRLFIELQVQNMKILSSNLGRTYCVQKLFDIQNNFRTQHNLPMFFKKKSF